jgi:hypothetical protein
MDDLKRKEPISVCVVMLFSGVQFICAFHRGQIGSKPPPHPPR